jgi:hypothetical protein
VDDYSAIKDLTRKFNAHQPRSWRRQAFPTD